MPSLALQNFRAGLAAAKQAKYTALDSGSSSEASSLSSGRSVVSTESSKSSSSLAKSSHPVDQFFKTRKVADRPGVYHFISTPEDPFEGNGNVTFELTDYHRQLFKMKDLYNQFDRAGKEGEKAAIYFLSQTDEGLQAYREFKAHNQTHETLAELYEECHKDPRVMEADKKGVLREVFIQKVTRFTLRELSEKQEDPTLATVLLALSKSDAAAQAYLLFKIQNPQKDDRLASIYSQFRNKIYIPQRIQQPIKEAFAEYLLKLSTPRV